MASKWDRLFLSALDDNHCVLCVGHQRGLATHFQELLTRFDCGGMKNDGTLCPRHIMDLCQWADSLSFNAVNHPVPHILAALRFGDYTSCSACHFEKALLLRFSRYLVQMARARQALRFSVCYAHYQDLVEIKGCWKPFLAKKWQHKGWWHTWLTRYCRVIIAPGQFLSPSLADTLMRCQETGAGHHPNDARIS
ncbi:hypothetical protein [Sulfobacillus thermosulfidooxidans]|uniref:hypothetical protein n=1 Tax=Sulfobacillus thermosulfidooxidans TaxID=28034 RepID=UPI0011121583|nr:hypothetical protein [Sulfobacillus thermosulfidooxidans]